MHSQNKWLPRYAERLNSASPFVLSESQTSGIFMASLRYLSVFNNGVKCMDIRLPIRPLQLLTLRYRIHSAVPSPESTKGKPNANESECQHTYSYLTSVPKGSNQFPPSERPIEGGLQVSMAFPNISSSPRSCSQYPIQTPPGSLCPHTCACDSGAYGETSSIAIWTN